MKKNKFFPVLGMVLSPILGMLFILGVFLAAAYSDLPGEYTGLGIMLWGTFLIVFLFPIWFAWYVTKHIKFVILPSLYTTAIFIIPFVNLLVGMIGDGITYQESGILSIIPIFFVWNVFWFAVMRLIRFIKTKHIKSCRTSSGE